MPRLLASATILTGALSVASCMTAAPTLAPAELEPNPRIEYRRLTAAHPIMRDAAAAAPLQLTPASDAPELKGDTITPSPVVTRPPVETPGPVYIDFANESATLDSSQLDLDTLKDAHDQGKRFFVMGQSHGPSSVGVQTLAVKRAQAVARALLDAGFDPSRIHTLASWSTTRVPFAPSRGVQIFVLESGGDSSRALLALQGS